jgi:cell division protein FtsQ
VSILIVSGVLMPVLYVWLTEGSALTIRTVRVHAGAHAKPGELQVYLREFVGKPLYGADLNRVRILAERHPWVASASVRREPPSTLQVDIVERMPVGLVKQGKLWVVDSSGVAFKPAESEEELSLPLIGELSQAQLLASHVSAGFPGGRVMEVHTMPHEQARVLFASGLEVIIGTKNFERQWAKLASVLKSLGSKATELGFVYLDDNLKQGQIAVRFKKG